MIATATLGFPRIGRRRELKRALEAYWKGRIDAAELNGAASGLRRERWLLQRDLGIDWIPSNDFSLYDHVLDTAAMVGAVPGRFADLGPPAGLPAYFAMARGTDTIRPMEMTKWFDTNYHYIVPEFEETQTFRLASAKPVEEFNEAAALGVKTVPVLLGPVTFLLLGKIKDRSAPSLDLLPRLLPVYGELLRRLREAGADWVQMDEPALVLDRSPEERAAFVQAYDELCGEGSPKVLLAAYFDGFKDNLETALRLPVAGIHLDLARAPDQLEDLANAGFPKDKMLSIGIVDGRNVWRNDLDASLEKAERALKLVGGDRLILSPSCPLLHVPWDLDMETGMDPEIRGGLAFAKQKIEELGVLKRALNGGKSSVAKDLLAARRLRAARRDSPLVQNKQVRARVDSLKPSSLRRNSPYAQRRLIQRSAIPLPLFPTTTIGSFPQTEAVRGARAQWRKGALTQDEYEGFLRKEMERCVRLQEEIGLDVLVHGEFERTDMVEYFGEQLDGFLFTEHGWVQSYGSRCVKPPVIYGDVRRVRPMTVGWAAFAQSLTERPVKGMLTGPVTLLQWSFVRDDQPRAATCRQLALAIRDEAEDLERAGIRVIQIDEPALREGLPLREKDREGYLRWAVECFRIASSGVRDETQIHTHMCYAEFGDIMPSIRELDADVISLESSRSDMELLGAFEKFSYENEVGPGVYDIHSPRVPGKEEMRRLIGKACEVIPPDRVWVNPDCGLKTRDYAEAVPALRAMVDAAREARASGEE